MEETQPISLIQANELVATGVMGEYSMEIVDATLAFLEGKSTFNECFKAVCKLINKYTKSDTNICVEVIAVMILNTNFYMAIPEIQDRLATQTEPKKKSNIILLS